MADLLDVRCLDCGARSRQYRGALMTGVIVRCGTCGQDERRPVELEAVFADTTPPVVEQPDICGCGGAFDADAPIRCRACRSTNVRSDVCGIAD